MKRFLATMATLALLLSGAGWIGGATEQSNNEAVSEYMYTVADDFIVDVYYNGEKVPDNKRQLLVERFGATAERINQPVKMGDWVVFHVVNNRMRWGGVYYFAVAGMKQNETSVGFTSELASRRWSCCDNPSNVSRFIADRDFLATNSVQTIEQPWQEGNELMKELAKEWSGAPVWGTSRSTWIKFIAR